MSAPSIKRVIDLYDLLIAFHGIKRQVLLPAIEHYREETDTEHSYTLAMLAWFIADTMPHLDTNKCIRYALAHDLVEIHAGDTFAFDKDQKQQDSKQQRELQARHKLQRQWPDFDQLHTSIAGYEARDDDESRFVYALDKLAPMMLNVLSEGKSWHHHGISMEELQAYKGKKVSVSPEIAALYEELLTILRKHPRYFPKSSTTSSVKP